MSPTKPRLSRSKPESHLTCPPRIAGLEKEKLL